MRNSMMVGTGFAQNARSEQILEFWFQNEKYWWNKSVEFDALVRNQFTTDLKRAQSGALDSWIENPRSCLAVVLLCDQFSRNMFRDTPAMYATDEKAILWTREALGRKYDERLSPQECQFLYMPLMHSEALEDQLDACGLFRNLANRGVDCYQYAVQHKNIVERFGRFPHRNYILNRTTTDEEREFLNQPGSSF